MDENALRSPSPAAGGRFFGYPGEMLFGSWTNEELRVFLRLSPRKASDLMKAPGAPRPLRMDSERCVRWNPYQVVAWLNGCPDAAAGLGRGVSPRFRTRRLGPFRTRRSPASRGGREATGEPPEHRRPGVARVPGVDGGWVRVNEPAQGKRSWRVTFPDAETGKPRERNRTTLEAAVALAEDLVRELARTTGGPSLGHRPVRDLVDYYMTDWRLHKQWEPGYHQERARAVRWLPPWFLDLPVQEWRTVHSDRVLAGVATAGHPSARASTGARAAPCPGSSPRESEATTSR